jgi:hypothetical protein
VPPRALGRSHACDQRCSQPDERPTARSWRSGRWHSVKCRVSIGAFEEMPPRQSCESLPRNSKNGKPPRHRMEAFQLRLRGSVTCDNVRRRLSQRLPQFCHRGQLLRRTDSLLVSEAFDCSGRTGEPAAGRCLERGELLRLLCLTDTRQTYGDWHQSQLPADDDE